MNPITNTLRTITTGLAMQCSAENLSKHEKYTCLKKAVEHKKRSSKTVTEKGMDKIIVKASSIKIDIDKAVNK